MLSLDGVIKVHNTLRRVAIEESRGVHVVRMNIFPMTIINLSLPITCFKLLHK